MLAVMLLLPVSMQAEAEKTSGVVRVLLTRVDTIACEIDFIPLWENEKKG